MGKKLEDATGGSTLLPQNCKVSFDNFNLFSVKPEISDNSLDLDCKKGNRSKNIE